MISKILMNAVFIKTDIVNKQCFSPKSILFLSSKSLSRLYTLVKYKNETKNTWKILRDCPRIHKKLFKKIGIVLTERVCLMFYETLIIKQLWGQNLWILIKDHITFVRPGSISGTTVRPVCNIRSFHVQCRPL